MKFEDILSIMNICPNCGSGEGIARMQYIGYKTIAVHVRIYFACNTCLEHYEFTLQGPTRLKDKGE